MNDLREDGRLILKWLYKKSGREGAWIGLIWVRIFTRGGLL
jgi:hypothetical protein